jgi:hypothetical protein
MRSGISNFAAYLELVAVAILGDGDARTNFLHQSSQVALCEPLLNGDGAIASSRHKAVVRRMRRNATEVDHLTVVAGSIGSSPAR